MNAFNIYQEGRCYIEYIDCADCIQPDYYHT